MMTTDTRAALVEAIRELEEAAFERGHNTARRYFSAQNESALARARARITTLVARSAPEERGEGERDGGVRDAVSEFVRDFGHNGSKTGRPDYLAMVPLDRIEQLRRALASPPAPAQEPDEGSDALTAAYFMGAADARRASLDALGGEVRPDAEAEAAFAAARAERTRVVDAARRRSAPPVAQGAETSREEREDPTGHATDCEWSVEREVWICHPSCDLHPAYRGVAQEAEPSLDDELHALHDRLRDEGRDADADLIDRAGWAMEAAGAEQAQGAEEPFVSASCDGEACALCDAPATMKIGEEIMHDDPMPNRHNLTQYVCARHAAAIFHAYRFRDGQECQFCGAPSAPQGLPREESRDPLYYSAGLQMAGSYLASGRIDDMRAVLETMVESARPVAGSEGRDGVALIAAERKRQVDVEWWTAEHDDNHRSSEMAIAAAVYAYPPDRPVEIKRLWPWARDWWKPEASHIGRVGATPEDWRSARIRVLVKAGALIAAEIDRLQRAGSNV